MADPLGLELSERAEGEWVLPVTGDVVAGSRSLYGGCGTAAALQVAARTTGHVPRWCATHFVGMAQRDSEVVLRSTVLSSGRTMAHVAVDAVVDDRPCFTTRVALGTRDEIVTQTFVTPPEVAAPDRCGRFDLPIHADTFAARWEWRLATPVADSGVAAWWVRPASGVVDGPTAGAVLTDYVTYGIGRAAGTLLGGISVDNTVRVHDPAPVDGWVLLEIRPDSLDGGFGVARARVWSPEGTLLTTGSQTVVLNTWDWRLPAERVDG